MFCGAVTSIRRGDRGGILARVERQGAQDSPRPAKVANDKSHHRRDARGKGTLSAGGRIAPDGGFRREGAGVSLVECGKQGLFRGKTGIEGPNRRPGALHDLCNRYLLELFLLQKLQSCLQNAVERLPAARLLRGTDGRCSEAIRDHFALLIFPLNFAERSRSLLELESDSSLAGLCGSVKRKAEFLRVCFCHGT